MAFSDKQVRALSRSVPHATSNRASVTARNSPTLKAGLRWRKPIAFSASTAGTAKPSKPSAFLPATTAASRRLFIWRACASRSARMDAPLYVTVTEPATPTLGSLGEVHDRALKAAETDATKRALATFGKAFGLALYAVSHDGTQRASGTRFGRRRQFRRQER